MMFVLELIYRPSPCFVRLTCDKLQASMKTILDEWQDHLLINISTGLAIAGIIILARSIRLITKFGTASEIPARFIERNVNLRGRVHRVTESGLEVEHVPINIPILSALLKKRRSDALLDVRLAGVELTEEGRAWLGQQLRPTETVWLRLIRREAEALDCLVSVSRGTIFNTCMNEELLRLGLGKTVPLLGLHHESRLYWGLHRRLLKAEVRAEKKGKGLWKERSLWQRVSEAADGNAAVRLFKRLFERT
ncbi:protein C3orf33 homolog isoform X2 [Anguilla rostrata]|uniref:protein C3orf33 homolog isoform X2 n=1 Tax=Anguilla rostrata TaxID=7938 RepID=UPI0030CC5840